MGKYRQTAKRSLAAPHRINFFFNYFSAPMFLPEYHPRVLCGPFARLPLLPCACSLSKTEKNSLAPIVLYLCFTTARRRCAARATA